MALLARRVCKGRGKGGVGSFYERRKKEES